MNEIGKQVKQLAEEKRPAVLEEGLVRSKSSTQRLLLPCPKPVEQEERKKRLPDIESACFVSDRPPLYEPRINRKPAGASDRFFALPQHPGCLEIKEQPYCQRDSNTLTEFIDLIEGKLKTKKSPRPCIRNKTPIKLVFKEANHGKKTVASPVEVKEGIYSTKSGRVFLVSRGPNGSLKVKFESKTITVSDFLILLRGESFSFEPAETKKTELFRAPVHQHRRTKTDSNLLELNRQHLKTKPFKLNNLF